MTAEEVFAEYNEEEDSISNFGFPAPLFSSEEELYFLLLYLSHTVEAAGQR